MKKIVAVCIGLVAFFNAKAQINPAKTKDKSILLTATDSLAEDEQEVSSEKQFEEFGRAQLYDEEGPINDSLILPLKDYMSSRRIDSLWLDELNNSDLFPKVRKAVLETPYSDVNVEGNEGLKKISKDTLKKRLAKLSQKTPFTIAYTPALEKTIRRFLGRDKKVMQRLMALSQYYFPLFEKELAKHNLPLELKYLPVIESALNPKAKSRVGATGLWQFMFSSAKFQDLTVSSYVDERMDPVRSTEAAGRYLKELYSVFRDWDMVLASYNSGPGTVSKAIRRSGGKTNYWKIRDYLPRETAGYVPAFFATIYLFNYAKEHGFKAGDQEIAYFETDTVRVKHDLKFKQIAKVTGIDEDLLSFLNPSYKLNIIPHIDGKEYAIRLPVDKAGEFVANEEAIYNYTEDELENENLPRYFESKDKIRYRVNPGDNLSMIAAKYGVASRQIKQWNSLRNNNLRAGQVLILYPKNTDVKTASSQKQKPSTSSKTYTVRRGDSLWSISRKFNGITVAQIKKWNDIGGKPLKPGMRIKVSGK